MGKKNIPSAYFTDDSESKHLVLFSVYSPQRDNEKTALFTAHHNHSLCYFQDDC